MVNREVGVLLVQPEDFINRFANLKVVEMSDSFLYLSFTNLKVGGVDSMNAVLRAFHFNPRNGKSVLQIVGNFCRHRCRIVVFQINTGKPF